MQKRFACWWILIDENKRILLIKRKYNKKNYPNYFALPWGWCENNETPEETVIREVKEEVNLDFIPEKLFIKDKLENENNLEVYRFLWKYSWKIVLQEEECDWYGLFTYEEAKKLLINKNIYNLLEKLHEENLI